MRVSSCYILLLCHSSIITHQLKFSDIDNLQHNVVRLGTLSVVACLNINEINNAVWLRL